MPLHPRIPHPQISEAALPAPPPIDPRWRQKCWALDIETQGKAAGAAGGGAASSLRCYLLVLLAGCVGLPPSSTSLVGCLYGTAGIVFLQAKTSFLLCNHFFLSIRCASATGHSTLYYSLALAG